MYGSQLINFVSLFAHEFIGERHKYNCLDSFCIFGLFVHIANCTLTSCPNFVVPLFLPVAFEGNIYMRVFVVQKDPSQHFVLPRFLFCRRVKIDLAFYLLIIRKII